MPNPSAEDQPSPPANRYGLSIRTSDDSATLVPWRETPSGSFHAISEPELKAASPEWFSILSLCQAQHKVDSALLRLPHGSRDRAAKLLKIVMMFNGRMRFQTDGAPIDQDVT